MVVGVGDLPLETTATIPLAAGLAVLRVLARYSSEVRLKWPNDVLVAGRKVAGILCERHGDNVIVGIGVNVLNQNFPPEIAAKAITVEELRRADGITVMEMRDLIIASLQTTIDELRVHGFAALHEEIASVDLLKGRTVTVKQTDDDEVPISGYCGGIMSDGSLDVGGTKIYAGEAHVLAC